MYSWDVWIKKRPMDVFAERWEQKDLKEKGSLMVLCEICIQNEFIFITSRILYRGKDDVIGVTSLPTFLLFFFLPSGVLHPYDEWFLLKFFLTS